MSATSLMGERIQEWAAVAVVSPVNLDHLASWVSATQGQPRDSVPPSQAIDRASLTISGEQLRQIGEQNIASAISQALLGEIEQRRIRVWERPMFRTAIEPDSMYNVFRHEHEHWKVIRGFDPGAYIQLFLSGQPFHQYTEYQLSGATAHAPLGLELAALCASTPTVLGSDDVAQTEQAYPHIVDRRIKTIIERRLAERPRVYDSEHYAYAFALFSRTF